MREQITTRLQPPRSPGWPTADRRDRPATRTGRPLVRRGPPRRVARQHRRLTHRRQQLPRICQDALEAVRASGSCFLARDQTTACELKLCRVPSRKRLKGGGAEDFAKRIVHAYTAHGTPIRRITEEMGRSYGAIHSLLKAHHVRRRPRGFHGSGKREEP